MAKYSGKDTKIFLALVLLSSFMLLISVSVASAVTVSEIGNMTSPRGWLFSQSTPLGVYYGFGWTGGSSLDSDIYFYNFATRTNTLVKSQTSQPDIKQPSVTNVIIWGYSMYSAIVGDKIFISNVYYHSEQPWDITHPWDKNGLYVIDTKTNTFYLYDRLPFDFFVSDWPSPMAAVGTDLYFFVGIPDRPDIASRVYRYNPATKESVSLAELPAGLGSGGIIYSVGSKIYITTYKYWEENSLYVYDTLTDKFAYLATSPLIPSNNYRANSVINGKLYFVGGEDPLKGEDQYINSVGRIVEYDPSINQFNVIDELGYGLLGASTTSVSGSLYVTGGEVHSEPEITNRIIKIEIIDPISEIAKSCPANIAYKSHGKYVSCVSKKAEEFLNSGLITEQQKDDIVSNAAKSAVGKR